METPAQAASVFGDRLHLAERYLLLLGSAGVQRGLIGPREVPNLWARHLLNCAAVAPLIPTGSGVTDVGSGAGLPGIVLALSRPDLPVRLVEPSLRRTTFLSEVIAELQLTDQVEVVRARAEDVTGSCPVVVARAVAPLEKLARTSWHLVRPGGALLAMKGRTAAEELERDRPRLPRDVQQAAVVACGDPESPLHATVVRLDRRGGRVAVA